MTPCRSAATRSSSTARAAPGSRRAPVRACSRSTSCCSSTSQMKKMMKQIAGGKMPAMAARPACNERRSRGRRARSRRKEVTQHAVKIRLTRFGSKKNPIYRVVVADSRLARATGSASRRSAATSRSPSRRVDRDRRRARARTGSRRAPQPVRARQEAPQDRRASERPRPRRALRYRPRPRRRAGRRSSVSEEDAEGRRRARVRVAEDDRGKVIGRRWPHRARPAHGRPRRPQARRERVTLEIDGVTRGAIAARAACASALVGRAHGLDGAFRVAGRAAGATSPPAPRCCVDGRSARCSRAPATHSARSCALEGVDAREDAAAVLGGRARAAGRATLPEPEEDAFWFRFDLVGCEVCRRARARRGRRGVRTAPRHDVLVLTTEDGREHRCRSARAVPGVDERGAHASRWLGVRRAARRVARRLRCSRSTSSRSSRLVLVALRGAARPARAQRAAVAALPHLRDYSPLPHRRSTTRRSAAGRGCCMRVDARGGRDRGRLRRRRSRACARSGASSCSTPAGAGSTTPTRASSPAGADLVLLCGRYEGFDQRVHDARRDGGARRSARSCSAAASRRRWPSSTPSARCLEGALGDDRVQRGGVVLAGARGRARVPALHAAAELRGWDVPEVLLSGDHGARRRAGAASRPIGAPRRRRGREADAASDASMRGQRTSDTERCA